MVYYGLVCRAGNTSHSIILYGQVAMHISIVAFDGFNEIDTFTTMGILTQMRGDGWRTGLVCPTPKIVSANGVTVSNQHPLEWANDADVVLFSSGSRMREVADDDKILRRLSLEPERQLLGAQCNGSLMLKSLHALRSPEVCAEHGSMAMLIQAGLKPVAAPLLVHGNVATGGGRLAASYLAAWVIWRLDSMMAAQHALTRVAPAGEEQTFVAHVLSVVRPFIEGAEAEVAAEPSHRQPAPIVISATAVQQAPAATEMETDYEDDEDDEFPVELLTVKPEPVSVETAAPEGPPLFGGMIETTGKILEVEHLDGDALRVMVSSGGLPMSKIGRGDRIAVNGKCLTIVAKTDHHFKFELPAQVQGTLTGLDEKDAEVNLERALAYGQAVNGHLLEGQVDGIGEVLKFAQTGESWQLVVQVDGKLAPCIAMNGRIAVNGVSLMTTQVKDVGARCIFSVVLDAQIMKVSALKNVRVGSKVNVEADMIARSLQGMLPPLKTSAGRSRG